MKQVIRRGLREIIVDEVPDPLATPHHVIVRPVYSLISSGTETASIHQQALVKEVSENPTHLRKVWNVMKVMGPTRTFHEVRAKFGEYAVLGYSGAGFVVEKHPTVSDLEVGDRVAYGGEGTGHGEAILVGRNLVVRVPDQVPFEHACFATLGSIALNALRIASVEVGERVAVIGMGLVGQLIGQLVRCQGGRLIALDLQASRLELAHQLGAEHVLLSSQRDAVGALTDGRGADCVIVAAASRSSAPARHALEICRDRGRLVVVGAVDLSFPWEEMYLKEIRVLMVRAYGPGSYDPLYENHGQDYPFSYVRWTENRNMEDFLRLIARGDVRVGPLITHEYPLEEAAKAYQTILNPAENSLAVVLRYPAPPDPAKGFRPVRKVSTGKSAPTAAPSRLEVGLAGAGNLARWVHLPHLKKLSRVRLRAIYSADGVRGKSYALRFGAAYCCSDYEELLKDDSIDVVLIASRNQHHASQALAALHAGKHVFVEKPMALTQEECRSLFQAVQQADRQLTVGFNRRFAPLYRKIRERLARRTGPAVLSCRVNSPGISGDYWMADPAIGGAILGEACHFADLLYWLLDSEPVAVSAFSLPTGQKEPIGENNLAASFHFADGSIANLCYSTVGSATSGGERLEAFAPGLGAICEDFKRLTLNTRVRRTRSRWLPEKGYFRQLQAFFSGIRSGKPPEVTVLDGARATIVCLAMQESARNRQPCTIDWEAALREA